MIHIDPLLITPLTYAAFSLPITWTIGKAINRKFDTLLISLLTSTTFTAINYYQFHDIQLAAQLGLLILGAAALIKLGIEIIKLIIAAILILIVLAAIFSQRRNIAYSIRQFIDNNAEYYRDENGKHNITIELTSDDFKINKD